MATVETGSRNQFQERLIGAKYDPNHKPILQDLTEDDIINSDLLKQPYPQFNPDKHLNYAPSSNHFTMQDLGIKEGISPIGATVAFQLFTQEAIDIMKHEILQPTVFEQCAFASNISKCQLRGYAKDLAPFTYAAWTHARTLEIVSKEAGVDLEIMFNYEVAHINLAVGNADEKKVEDNNNNKDNNNNNNNNNKQEESSVVGWHFDSYPFVCVLMLTDLSKSIGGETCFRNERTGELVRVADPKRGSATVLQGRYIEHIAMKPKGQTERITMVTSYRPRNPLCEDESVLTTVAGISRKHELYQEWTDYRLDNVIKRLQVLRQELKNNRESGSEEFDVTKLGEYLSEQEAYLRNTHVQM